MYTIPTGAPNSLNYLQTLCLYKGSVGTNCITIPDHASLGQHWTAGKMTVSYSKNGGKTASEDRLVSQGFLLQQEFDPKHLEKRTTWWPHNMDDQQSPDLNPMELVWDEVDRR